MTSRNFGYSFGPFSPSSLFLATRHIYCRHKILNPFQPWRHLLTTTYILCIFREIPDTKIANKVIWDYNISLRYDLSGIWHANAKNKDENKTKEIFSLFDSCVPHPRYLFATSVDEIEEGKLSSSCWKSYKRNFVLKKG